MTSQSQSSDITRIMLSASVISILAIGSFWVLRPFLSATLWASLIVIPTWPMMLWMKDRLRGSRALAVLVIALFLFVLVFAPIGLLIKTIIGHTDTLIGWAKAAMEFEMPPAPPWVARIPIVGAEITVVWQRLIVYEGRDFASQLAPYLINFVKMLPSQLGNAGMIFIHFVLTLIISIILYLQGENAAAGIRAFARRLAGEKGDQAILLAAQAIKAVAMGIIVTALVQAAVAWVGFIIAGIPYSILLTAIIFVLSVVQIGSWLVLAPTIIWLYWSGSFGWGTFLLIWSLLVMGLDNFLRPYLIKKGANLPLLLIFAGVLGGLITFGIIGLFIGPVVLAVSYTLINAWIAEAL